MTAPARSERIDQIGAALLRRLRRSAAIEGEQRCADADRNGRR